MIQSRALPMAVLTFGVSLMSVALAGCPSFQKAPGPQFTSATIPADKAVIHFYRPPQKVMSDYPLFMSLPESANNCFRLESGGYTSFVTEPGKVTIAGAMVSYLTKTYELKAGEERYVQVDIVDDNAQLNEVPADQGKAKIASMHGIETCSPSDVKKK